MTHDTDNNGAVGMSREPRYKRLSRKTHRQLQRLALEWMKRHQPDEVGKLRRKARREAEARVPQA